MNTDQDRRVFTEVTAVCGLANMRLWFREAEESVRKGGRGVAMHNPDYDTENPWHAGPRPVSVFITLDLVNVSLDSHYLASNPMRTGGGTVGNLTWAVAMEMLDSAAATE